MNHALPASSFRWPVRPVALPLLAAGALVARAQTAPAPAYAPPTAPAAAAPAANPNSPDLATMNDEIVALQRLVGQLRLDVDALQQDNDNLHKQLLSQTDVNTAVQNAISKYRDDVNKAISQAVTQSNADLRKDIVATVSKQIEDLARDFNTQIQTLAQEIGKAPPVSSRVTAVDPNKAPPAATNQNGFVYYVHPGETLTDIAKKNHVSVSELMQVNNLTQAQANLIRSGQSLFIPLKNGAAPPASSN